MATLDSISLSMADVRLVDLKQKHFKYKHVCDGEKNS